jgi:Trichohyalin-plectin-homology domain
MAILFDYRCNQSSLAVLWCRAHQELIEKGRREAEKLHKQNQYYLTGIQKQIRDKEESRIQARRNNYEEGTRLVNEIKKRRQNLNEAKFRKLNELRSPIISIH